ncbi:MAG TPA: imidazolonepropionase [Saprospiraceae bacterium]|nr:imidazolonepropionase [Saprospiraceae bacterium]
MSSTLITNIKSIVGIQTQDHNFKKGQEMSQVSTLEHGFILIENEKIADFGPMTDAPDRADIVMDATDRLVLPSWCDSHTHIVYAAGREGEYVDRLRGVSYEEIAKKGGGILNSANKLQVTSEEDLYLSAKARLDEVIAMGTGAIEIKSGYGLTTESELKMLRVIRKLKENSPIEIKASFLGAHAIPMIYKENRNAYIDIITNEMLPQVAHEGLADYCDVFCDKGFYTVEETDRILKAASSYGLKAKIHANELAISGGVQVGIANNAISVDHLEAIGDEEIQALKNSNTIPTVLPSCSFFLNIHYAPARKMIDQGLGIAIATDYNPGSSPSGNIPLLMAFACNNMRILPNEAFNGVTINGACALELGDTHGSIARGKVANLILTHAIPSLDYMVYSFGTNHVDKVLLKGKLI